MAHRCDWFGSFNLCDKAVKVIFVYNPRAGSSLERRALRRLCKKNGITVEHFIVFDDMLAHHLLPHIKAAKTIVAMGGDGTVSAVASLVAGTRAVLAPLPGGTLNHFVKDLGIPADLELAIKNLAHSQVTKVDVASVNGRIFINNSSLGLYPMSLRERSKFEKYIGKWTARVVGSLRALLRFRTYVVTINDETFETPFLFVGNNQYDIESIGFSRRERLDGGNLSIFVARTTSRMQLLKLVGLAIIGKAGSAPEFNIRYASSLSVRTHRMRVYLSRDGELISLDSPLEFRIHPGALKIRV